MQISKSTGILIKQIHDALEKHTNNALRDKDLTMAQLNALLALSHSSEKQASLKELERILRVAQSTTAGIISRLEQKGFVESFGDAADKRIKIVRITSLGEKFCQLAEQGMEEAESILLAGLTDIESDMFLSLLQKVSNNLN